MKIIVRVIIILVIAVPIFMCWKTLQTVWDEPENKSSVVSTNTGNTDISSGESNNEKKNEEDDENKVYAKDNLGDGVSYDVTGLNIISKVYENAEVAISVANIYEEHSETSKIVGKLNKGAKITVQNYDNGWSTVTDYKYSGWMKTENIKLPSETTSNMVVTQPTEDGAKLGVVKVTDGLNVRATASKTADIIASLKNGDVVTVIDDSTSGWYKIKVGSTTGWVSSDYVTIQN